MSMIFFTYRARTQARMGAGILQKAGIEGKLARTPARLASHGCGYGLWVPERQGQWASEVLRQKKSPYARSYLVKGDHVQEVTL